jgi:hypothetical protein
MTNIGSIAPETLIASERVEGKKVYDLAGHKLGKIDDILIDKVTGVANYAVMSFGGFLGMARKHHPLPWASLHYDLKKNGYVVDLDKARLEAAPRYDPKTKNYVANPRLLEIDP